MGDMIKHYFKIAINLIFLGVYSTGCRTLSRSEAKDVASDFSHDKTLSGVFLYYVEGEEVVRAKCDANADQFDNFNRSNCNKEIKKVPLQSFTELVSRNVG